MYNRYFTLFLLFVVSFFFLACNKTNSPLLNKHLDLEQQINAKQISLDSLVKVSHNSKDSLLLGYLNLYQMDHQIRSNQLDSILYHADITLSMSRKFEDDYLLARAGQLLGRYYILTSDYARSLKFYLESTSYFEKTNDSIQLLSSYNDLGGFYLQNDEFEKAQSFFTKSFNLATEQNNVKIQALFYANISSINLAKKDYDKAMSNLKLALETFEGVNDTVNQIKAYSVLGELSIHQQNFPVAKAHYDYAYLLATQSKKKNLLGPIYIGYGKIEQAKNNYSQAITFYLKAYEINHAQKLYREEIDALEVLYQAYQQQKQNDKALIYIAKYYQQKELVNGAKINQQLEALRWSSILDDKQHQSELEQQKHKTSFIIQIGFIVFIASLTLLFAILYYTKRKHLQTTQELNHQLVDKIKTEEALKTLQEEKYILELENKDRELTTLNIQLLSKNTFLNDIDQLIKNEKKDLVSKLKEIIHTNRNLEKDWEQFTAVFEKVHPTFFQYIHQHYPELSKTEIKVCAYIKINFNNYEIASLLNIDYQSVLTNRYRIRKKINLPNTEDLYKTIASW